MHATSTVSTPSPFVFRAERRPSARCRLLCLAHAGGSASAFATWHRGLPADVEVCAVQLPGREMRHSEPPILDIEQLVGILHTELAPLHDLPVALFGHSLGGLLAFEYARRLQRERARLPVHLIVSGSSAPEGPRPGGLSQLDDQSFVRMMSERYDGIPQVILNDPDLLEYFLPILRSDIQLLESYRYLDAPPLACPITALGGDADPRVPATELARWRAHTTADFRSVVFPGGHFYLTPARDAVLATLAEVLRVPA